jgi:3-methyl-2-oxobutanoate hydroxymethyltransferase
MKGKTDAEAEALMADLRAVVRAGAFSVVIECTRHSVAAMLTAASPVPTIGIGSGHGTCHGEVSVFHDLVGGFPWFTPGFVKPKANIAEHIIRGVTEWKEELLLPQADA